MKTIITKLKKYWVRIAILFILTVAVAWAGKGIFKYSVFSTHDGDHHLARAYDVLQTVKEGQFPLRWAGSLNYLCGAPIYNFYYPLLYYLIALINPIFNNVIFSFKVIFFLALLVGTLAFYLWAHEETGKNLPAIAGAIVYLFAPYRFLLIFVRGSPEYLAYSILPVVLFFYSRAFKSENRKSVLYAFLASLTGGILTISHNFTVMFLVPIIFIYLLAKIYTEKLDRKKIIWIAFSFIGMLGIGSFFLGPAILEQKYTQIGSNFLMWKDHFPELWQLWNSKWGYFYSASGTADDGMSFMLGYAQWIILGLSAVFIPYQFIKSKRNIGNFVKENIWILIFFLGSIFTIYLILPWSIPIWERVKPLQEIQFSWRLLGVAVFTIAALFVFVLDKIKIRFLLVLLAVGISLFAIIAERNHMLPQPIDDKIVYQYTDFENLHPHRYSSTTLGDEVLYPTAVSSCWFSTPTVSGDKELPSKIVERKNLSGFIKFTVDKKLITSDKITFALGYFPGIYKINLNGDFLSSYQDCGGKVCLDKKSMRDGDNFISWNIVQSPIENLFNCVSLVFLVTWLILLIGFTRIKKYLPFLIIFSIFIFFRTYNINNRLGFGWDQERDANVILGILNGHPTLLGPRVQGPMGFYLPPYFFYILAPFYKITDLSPLATSLFVVFWSSLFFVASYILISKSFSKRVALIFLSLWAVNPLAVSIDVMAWNPVVIPLLVVLLIYLRDKRNLFWPGFVLGLGTCFHMQFLFMAALLIPTIINVLNKKNFKELLYFLIGFAIPFLPILIFDIRHNFLNVKMVMEFVRNGSSINRVLQVWSNVSSFMIGFDVSNKYVGLIVYFATAIGLYMKGKGFRGIFYVWLASIPLFFVLVKNPSEYYFNYLLVILILAISLIINLDRKIWQIVLLIILIFFSSRSISGINSVHFSLQEKIDLISSLEKITRHGSSFNVSFDVPANEDSGYRYLMNLYKVKYSGNPNDPLIEFVVPPERKSRSFIFYRDTGIYIPSGWTNNNWLK